MGVQPIGAADDTAQEPADAVLNLANGGFVRGVVKGSDDPRIWRWQGTQFTQPFDFRAESVGSIDFPIPEVLPKPEGEFGFELAGGDLVFGVLREWNDSEIEIETARTGRVHIRRPDLAELKRERLLTLPRSQKTWPPTHLICATSGDILRGRLVAMDAQQLHIEIHLETRVIPRDRVARIIWLHPDEWSNSPQPSVAANDDGENGTRVHILRTDGSRLTMRAQHITEEKLSGRNDVLGVCQAEMSEVGQLLFGSAIEKAAAELAEHQWRLHPAVEPIYLSDSAGGVPALSNRGSELAGQASPDVEMELLDGQKMQLSERRGRVVVLEFWATWCGPCLETLRQVDRIVRELHHPNIEFFAVNMDEAAAKVSAALQRHKLALPVALDRDGYIAKAFHVTAIPMVFVIDRSGKVDCVFLGDSSQLAEQLPRVLQRLVLEPSPQTP